jgi:hypothetical protein
MVGICERTLEYFHKYFGGNGLWNIARVAVFLFLYDILDVCVCTRTYMYSCAVFMSMSMNSYKPCLYVNVTTIIIIKSDCYLLIVCSE